MATVAGLTRTQDTGTGTVTRAEGRAPTAPNKPAPDFQPQAAPVNVYARPEDNTAAAGSDLRQLAAALGQINPKLNDFIGTYATDQKAEAEAAAAGKIGGMTFDQAQQAVQEGSMDELQNPWFRAAFMKQFGQRVALKKAQELTDQYNNGFNKDGGDVEKLVAGTAKPVIDQYGNDKHFVSGFTSVFNPQAAKIRTDQAGYQSTRVATEVRQGVYEIGTAIIGSGINGGKSADEIVGQLRSTYAGNKQLLNVPYAEQDAEVFRIAQTLTKGISQSSNPKLQMEVVQKLLSDDRVAPDGYKLGPLAQNRQFADKAVTLLDQADKEYRQYNQKTAFDSHSSWYEMAQKGLVDDKAYQQLVDEHQSNPGRWTDTQVLSIKHMSDTVLETRRKEAAALEEKLRARQLADAQHNEVIGNAAQLAGSGNLWAVKDAKVTSAEGEEKTLTAEKIKGEIVDNFMRRSQAVAQQNHETPAQTFDRESNWFGMNGQTNPQWESLLKSGYMQGTAANLSGNKLPPAFDQATELYNQLYAKNPQLLSKHLDDASMSFYEAVRFGTQVAGFDKRTAAINALEVNKDPTKYESPSWKQKFDDIQNAVRATGAGWFGGPDNAGELAPQIEQAAKYFAKLGASPQVAVEEAKKRVKANYVDVNNYLVKTGDRAIPQSFPDMAKSYIDDYVTKYGEKEGVTSADLTVQPIGNGAGQWRIVLKKSPGMIVDHPEGIFDLPKLMDAQKERTARAQADKVKQLNQQLDTPFTPPANPF